MSAQHTPGPVVYPLSVDGEPMYCVCDHGGLQTDDWCKACPHRAENREAAKRDLEGRLAAVAEGGAA